MELAVSDCGADFCPGIERVDFELFRPLQAEPLLRYTYEYQLGQGFEVALDADGFHARFQDCNDNGYPSPWIAVTEARANAGGAVYLQLEGKLLRWPSLARVGSEPGEEIWKGVLLAPPHREDPNCCGL